jgi:hypothetical protein
LADPSPHSLFTTMLTSIVLSPRAPRQHPHGRGLVARASDRENLTITIKDCPDGSVAVQKSPVLLPPHDAAAATSLLDLTTNVPEASNNNDDNKNTVVEMAELEAANHRLAAELTKYKAHAESMTATTTMGNTTATDLGSCGLPPLLGRKTIRKLQMVVLQKEEAIVGVLHQVDRLKEDLAQATQDLVQAKAVAQKTLEDVKTQARADQDRYETSLATIRASTEEQHKKDLTEITANGQAIISTLQTDMAAQQQQLQTEQARVAELEKIMALAKEKIDQLESTIKEKDALLDKAKTEAAALEEVVKAKEIELKKHHKAPSPYSSPNFFESMKSLVSPTNAAPADAIVAGDLFSPAPIPVLANRPFAKNKIEELTTAPEVAGKAVNFAIDTNVNTPSKSGNNKAPLTPVPASRTKKSMLSAPRSILKSAGRRMFSPGPKIPLSEVSKNINAETNKNDAAMAAEDMKLVTFADNTTAAYDSPIVPVKSDENATPVPMTPKKTPFSLLKKPSSIGSSLRRSARKPKPTDRFTPDEPHHV